MRVFAGMIWEAMLGGDAVTRMTMLGGGENTVPKLGENGDLPRETLGKNVIYQGNIGKIVIYPGNIGEILLKRNARPFKEWLMIWFLHVITPQPYYSIVNRYSTLQPT